MSTQRSPVGWFEIYVQDMERAKAFYQRVFEVNLERLESPGLELWSFPMGSEKPGCTGALVKMPGKDSGVGGTIVYFVCEDCGWAAPAVDRTPLEHQRIVEAGALKLPRSHQVAARIIELNHPRQRRAG